MFEKSGGKIRKLGEIIFTIPAAIGGFVILSGFIIGISMPYGGGVVVFVFLVIGAIIILLAWINSLFLIAFGDLVNSNERIVELLEYKILDVGDKKELINKAKMLHDVNENKPSQNALKSETAQ